MTAWAAWHQAVASFEQVERLETAWKRVHAALDLFAPGGRLNDRGRAQSEIAVAMRELSGPDWSQVRNVLNDRQSLAFLDRMHRRLEAAEPRRAWREAMIWRWRLRHGPPQPSLMALLQTVAGAGERTSAEQASYGLVAAVLGDMFRASSAVESMNSVLRMQPSRHWRMTPMLDLERLYGTTQPFRSGPRKAVCPSQRLGLKLTRYDFWE